jgi:hypothetical protein
VEDDINMTIDDITEDMISELVGVNASIFEQQCEPEHWVHGWEEGFSYCPECVEKKIEELLKEKPDEEYECDGGWGIEGDGMPSCETCGKTLLNSFTTYACESQLDHFEEYGFDLDEPSDCYSMERILGSVGFLDGDLTPRIKSVILKAIEMKERKSKE